MYVSVSVCARALQYKVHMRPVECTGLGYQWIQKLNLAKLVLFYIKYMPVNYTQELIKISWWYGFDLTALLAEPYMISF